MRIKRIASLAALSLASAGALGTAVSVSHASEARQQAPTAARETTIPLIAQSQGQPLKTVDRDGVPQGTSKQDWMAAEASVSVDRTSGDGYRITLNASNLVPNGLYTFWWVNPKLVGMDLGPAGGVPGNKFRADANGNATATITVPASASGDYDKIALAYHADDRTHGQKPGEFGEVTFTQFMGPFPSPN